MNTLPISEKVSVQEISGKGQVIVINVEDASFEKEASQELLDQIRTYASANALVDANSRANILLNMQGVELLDSAGLSALVSALQVANDLESSLSLCAIAGPVRLVLELTKLDRAFNVFESYEAFADHVKSNRRSYVSLAVA